MFGTNLAVLFTVLALLDTSIAQNDSCGFSSVGVSLLYSNGTHILLLDISGSGNIRTLYKEANAAIDSLDFHYTDGSIYWSDNNAETINRITCPLKTDLPIKEEIRPRKSNSQPYGIAVDDVNNHLYWTDMEAGSITRSDLNGTNQHILVDSLTKPVAIELDVINGLIYVSDHRDHTIQKMKLDGNDRQTFVSGVITPYSLVIDYITQRLYWSDSADIPEPIKSVSLDGSDQKTLSVNVDEFLKLTSRPIIIGLDVYGNNLYGSDIATGIYRVATNIDNAVPVHLAPGEVIFCIKVTTKDDVIAGKQASGANMVRIGARVFVANIIVVLISRNFMIKFI